MSIPCGEIGLQKENSVKDTDQRMPVFQNSLGEEAPIETLTRGGQK